MDAYVWGVARVVSRCGYYENESFQTIQEEEGVMNSGRGGPSGVGGVGRSRAAAQAQKPIPPQMKAAMLGLHQKIKKGAKFGARTKVVGGQQPIYRVDISIAQLQLRVISGQLTKSVVDKFVAAAKSAGVVSKGKITYFVNDKARKVARNLGTLIAKLKPSKGQPKVKARFKAVATGVRKLSPTQQAVAKFVKARKVGRYTHNVTIDVAALKRFARTQPQKIKAKMNAFLGRAAAANLIKSGKISYQMRGGLVFSKNAKAAIPSRLHAVLATLAKVAIA